jgi:hypothetical protein
MRCTLDRRTIALVVAVVATAACRSSQDVPEAGALLLQVKLAPGARTPDEVRVFVYDDAGALWNDVRVPAQGPLVPQSAMELGTILIHPGVTVGDLRFDLRGLSSGALVAEGTLKIPAAAAGGTFEVTLTSSLPSDSDGDGVPDPVDDCPAIPDAKQGGCPIDGGVTDAALERRDAAADARPDGPAARPDAGRTDASRTDAGRPDTRLMDAGRADAGRDVPGKAKGAVCGAAGECESGFCKDGVCCNSACTDACNSCTTGTCTAVKNATDAPECIAPMTCNPKGKCVAGTAAGN